MLLGQQPKINLVLGLHNHQPFGNLDWVVDEACDKAYSPFLAVLERHPAIKTVLHYSGSLLEWFMKRRPALLDRLKKLGGLGQVEMVGGAFYEPILAIIPDDNKIEQIVHHRQTVQRLFDQTPAGMWLTERAWEPHLVKSIADAGMSWTFLDDTHFVAAGFRGPELYGYYQSEEQGQFIQVFPINGAFGALLPFEVPKKAIDFLRLCATPDGARLVVAIESGEKFGHWPRTFKLVYEEGWLDEFFTLLEENADWIHLTTIGEYRTRTRPWGTAYIPAGSYGQMQHWALPPELASEFESALSAVPEPYKYFLQGGYWRQFLGRYPESNNLHKKMLAVAELVGTCMHKRSVLASPIASQEPGAYRDDWVNALHHLWRGQSNDPYWHGLFGGLYLPHLRSASYRALLSAERICDALLHGTDSFLEVRQDDFDGDGIPEIVVRNRLINAYFSRRGGSLFELDYKPLALNLIDTLARRPESYHAKLTRAVFATGTENLEKTHSVRELVLPRDEGVASNLYYDWYRRVSLLDHFLHPDSQFESFQNVTYGEQGDFVIEWYEATVDRQNDQVLVRLKRDGNVWIGQDFWPITVEKHIAVPRDQAVLTASYQITNRRDQAVRLWFGVEFNANFQPGNLPETTYYFPELDLSEPLLGSKGELENLKDLVLRDRRRGIDYQIRWQHPATVWRFPVETISQSEKGFERVYQGSAVMPHWSLQIAGGKSWTTWVEQRITDHQLQGSVSPVSI